MEAKINLMNELSMCLISQGIGHKFSIRLEKKILNLKKQLSK